MWSKTATTNFRRVRRELPIFLAPFINAAIQQCRVIAMAKIIERIEGPTSHRVPRRGINHHARIIAYAQLLKSVFELFCGRKLGVVAFSSTGDPEMGDYDDEPTVFFRKGQLPAAFD